MKSFITALALVAIAEASWGGYGAGSYGGARHGAVGNRLGATNFSSETVLGRVDRYGSTPAYGSYSTHYDDYNKGNNGWKGFNKGYGDAGASGKTYADEAKDGYKHSGEHAAESGYKDAGAQGSRYRDGGSDDWKKGASKWAAGAGNSGHPSVVVDTLLLMLVLMPTATRMLTQP